MEDKLWSFIDNLGSFTAKKADKIKTLYFPLCNERIMSSLSSDLHGDIKTSQNSFLLTPVSRRDLVDSKSYRNFWVYPVRNTRKTGKKNKISNGVYLNEEKIWSVVAQGSNFQLEAGLLWHKVTRENKKIGLSAQVLSFLPSSNDPAEIMQVKFTNIAKKNVVFIPTAAIPIYGRGANSIRDHRHVTSLLQRIKLDKFGVLVKPTLVFDESGHRPNKNIYFVLGWGASGQAPQYIYPTQEMFCGESGDLGEPQSVFENSLPEKVNIQGKEAMGALRFSKVSLRPNESCVYAILMGVADSSLKIKALMNKFKGANKIEAALNKTKEFWAAKSQKINFSTDDADFDNWLRWVGIQPHLRRIFGCSFLPDFDYGKGGRGWRDLWQDCLGLILDDPGSVRKLLLNNFSGIRIDGSNATIIGKNPGEFISDRNNIPRVWMDHGFWPLLTLELYLDESADLGILFEETSYFRNHEIHRSGAIDPDWKHSYGQKLKTASGKIYQGTILEHLLTQNLVQFFNVGSHNYIRLEGADWNDGLDMAKENGESVAFSAMYARNLKSLSELLLKTKERKIKIAKELSLLLRRINYNNIKDKQKILKEYFAKTESVVSGEKISIESGLLAKDLSRKAAWMMQRIRAREWLQQGFFNGYYDNKKQRVEGLKNGVTRMMLASQAFPILSGVATQKQIEDILRSADRYLWDKKFKGYHLNTNFSRTSSKTSGGIPLKAGKQEEHNLGRAFSFVYGEKENGAFFNHMVVMFGFALYKRGFVKEAWKVLDSVYNMAINSQTSKIYPCLPEYFNLEGRGMYSYLTGSASWFMLALVNQVFGVRGQNGDLLIEPKLCLEQFKQGKRIGIERSFANRRLRISFSNPKKLAYGKYKIIKVSLNSRLLPAASGKSIIISRKTILNLPSREINIINILLG